jgi:hypothetical protein
MAEPKRVDFQSWNDIDATPEEFRLNAGVFGLTLLATWGGGNVVLERRLPEPDPDTPSYVAMTPAFGTSPATANGYSVFYLPAGLYRLSITTATGVSGRIEKIASGFGP